MNGDQESVVLNELNVPEWPSTAQNKLWFDLLDASLFSKYRTSEKGFKKVQWVFNRPKRKRKKILTLFIFSERLVISLTRNWITTSEQSIIQKYIESSDLGVDVYICGHNLGTVF